MGSEYIIQGYMRPGFPKYGNSERGYRTMLEYVGPQSQLEAQQPAINDAWGFHTGLVSNTNITPIEGTSQAVLRVDLEYFYSQADLSGEAGTIREVTYEVEWVVFSRSLYEHPVFAIGEGGTYALTSEDVSNLEAWKNEGDPVLKKDFKFQLDGGSETTLSTNAKMFARGFQLGQENFEDYAPVVRVTTAYANGGPSTSEAGTKDNPPSEANGPSGYEWRKSADRGIRSGGQTRWDRVEEWTGAVKVLTDSEAVFWTAP